MNKRLAPKIRKTQILNAAIEQAKLVGYQSVTRESVAEAAKCSAGLVTKYFGTMLKLRRSVMRAAVHRRIPQIVAQGLAAKDAQARGAPEDLRQQAISTMVE